MRAAHPMRPMLAGLAVLAAQLASPMAAHAQDLLAGAPHDLSVTIYRNPYRESGGFDLDDLGGFALITETRRVVLPAGEHRLRFEGVADGIEPASAIVTGLPNGVIEKNRDAALISPSALIEAAEAQGGRVLMTRAAPGSGVITRTPGTIRSGADGGVVVETPDGVEALRCSGLPESVSFEPSASGLSARPTLSVLTRSTGPVEAVVQLSYLARGFDWAADYIIDMKGGGKLDLGAWVTLANGNGVGFTNARVQVIAGRLNRETGYVEPIDIGRPILALCWPQGSTSDPSSPIVIERAYPFGFGPGEDDYDRRDVVVVTGALRAATQEDAALPVSVFSMEEAENLGDLKLYRVPDRTTIASRQSKQIRLLDKDAVPVTKVYEANYVPTSQIGFQPMTVLLRTRNDKQNNLALPLPSGRVAAFEVVGTGASAQRLLAGETSLRDIAVNEEVELRFPGGADVQARHVYESRGAVPTDPSMPFLPGFNDQNAGGSGVIGRIELSNAHPYAVQVEVNLYVGAGTRLVRADHPAGQKDGRPIFRLTLPANETIQIRYQVAY